MAFRVNIYMQDALNITKRLISETSIYSHSACTKRCLDFLINCALVGYLRTIQCHHLLEECLQSLVFLWGCWYHCLCLLLLLGTEFSWQQTDHLEELPDVPGQWMLRQKDVHQMMWLMIASLTQTGPQGHSGERKFYLVTQQQQPKRRRKTDRSKVKTVNPDFDTILIQSNHTLCV